MTLKRQLTRALLWQACICLVSSSFVLRGGTIVGWNSTTESINVIRNGTLVVTDSYITAVYAAGEEPDNIAILSENQTSPEVIDVTDKIITPGFIDTHRHGWQTVYRTLRSNVSLWEYLGRYSSFSSEGRFTPDDVYISQLTGLYEALNAGVTTMLDHAHHTWSNETSKAGLQASIDSGARVFWAYAFQDLQNYTIDEQIANFKDIANDATFDGTPTTLGIAYDAFYSDKANLIVPLTREYNISALTTHFMAGPWDSGNDPELLDRLGLLNTSVPVVISHGSYISARQYELLRRTNQYISITPESEMHYGHLHPTSHLALEQASLGIDAHFTYSTDILTQARMWLQRVRAVFYTTSSDAWQIPINNPMSVNQAFYLATRSGGLALRRPDLGIIAPGAKADLVVWDGTSPGLLGWVDPVAAVILHASVADIEHVLVDGRFVKRNRALTAPNYQAVKKRFLKSARRIQDIMINTPLPISKPGEKSIFGAPLGYAPVADVERGNGTGYGPNWLSL
ncbi:amidohydrolase [Ilyonectria destructans]|nr:amidohydrolase [Ilyonectria destructans]